jgi:hypothetical protein
LDITRSLPIHRWLETGFAENRVLHDWILARAFEQLLEPGVTR